MLKIRLQRFGKKNQPSFRVVVGDSRNSTKSGRFKEMLGWVNPLKHERSLNHERILHWVSQGAQTSDTMHNLLVKEGVLKGPKRNVAPRAKKEAENEKTPAVEANVLGEKEAAKEEPEKEKGAEEEKNPQTKEEGTSSEPKPESKKAEGENKEG